MANENRAAGVWGARWNKAAAGWLKGGKERTAMMICSLRAVKAVRQLQGSLSSCAAVARLEDRYRAALATETTRGTFKYNQSRYSGERLNFVISTVGARAGGMGPRPCALLCRRDLGSGDFVLFGIGSRQDCGS